MFDLDSSQEEISTTGFVPQILEAAIRLGGIRERLVADGQGTNRKLYRGNGTERYVLIDAQDQNFVCPKRYSVHSSKFEHYKPFTSKSVQSIQNTPIYVVTYRYGKVM
ncbi:hypothetical protein QTP88_022926 [Uroleucon formosanum]